MSDTIAENIDTVQKRALLIKQFLAHLHRQGNYSYWWTDRIKLSVWWRIGEFQPLPKGDINIYFGVHPCIRIPPKNSEGKTDSEAIRGQIAYIAAINCLFAEFDAKDFDHKKENIIAHIHTLAKQPSVLIDSGGGYHAYWLLNTPFVIEDDKQRAYTKRLQAAWVIYTNSDKDAKDLARILRLPGTKNYKYSPPRPVEFIYCNLEQLYTIEELAALVPADLLKEPERQIPLTNNVPTFGDKIRYASKWLDKLAPYRCDDYQEWVNVGFALSELGNIGLQLWSEWSNRSSKHVEGECEKKWKSFDPGNSDSGGGNISLRSLAHWAKSDNPGMMLYDDWDDLAGIPPEFIRQLPAPTIQNNTNGHKPKKECGELPENARLPEDLGKNACPWLDNYIAFSKYWSPRSFDGFHEATALWLLSTIAARRVVFHLGKPRYTNLYILLGGRTTIHAKSSATDIGHQMLKVCALDFFLAPDEATPQSFISCLSKHVVPENYDDLDDEQQTKIRMRIAFVAQRGWYAEEFGSWLASMMRTDGVMADFRGLLRRFDDNPDEYEKSTVSRGIERVVSPYLALIANCTPADLKPLARKGTQLWGDGFLARFSFITPPQDEMLIGRFPDDERKIPLELAAPLAEWHNRLGIPTVEIYDELNEESEPTGKKKVSVNTVDPQVLKITKEVKDAYYNYLDGVIEIARASGIMDLDGNYGRLAEKAMRIAALFASLGGCKEIELRHWARAQEITEHWREYMYRLYEQVTRLDVSENEEREDKVLEVMKKWDGSDKYPRGMTVNDISKFTYGISKVELQQMLIGLVKSGIVEVAKEGRALRFMLLNE